MQMATIGLDGEKESEVQVDKLKVVGKVHVGINSSNHNHFKIFKRMLPKMVGKIFRNVV